jgi:hypothetical protein
VRRNRRKGYRCPNCKRGDEIRVAATVWVLLTPDGESYIGSTPKWGTASDAVCDACKWTGTVGLLE